MSLASRGGSRRALRFVVCLAALAGALAISGAAASVASADCTTGGSGCLPASGYTLDSTWDCGAINSLDGTNCWANGTLNINNAVSHTWGWGSAAYNGAGSTTVQIVLESHVSASGTNLARVCYFANCNDQDSTSFRALVQNFSLGGIRHTVFGHGMA